ncbi:STAS domain-containing protein [Planosporangium sp. 12N6]|uniref:STAS domain-containing protein n=1 Tax=Planosporangium spinosum TaxID=3402278 RepID=UPI003CEA0AD0
MSLSIQTRRRGDRETVIALHGEVDYATALDLRAAISATLSAGDVDTIVVDLSGVTFLDSTGVGTLVVATRICDDYDVEFRVCDPNPFIAKLFTVVGVAEMLGIPAAPGVPARMLRPRIPSPASQVA